MKRNFPKLSLKYLPFGCEESKVSKETGELCKKAQRFWFEKTLEVWQVLYNQCKQGMAAEECISKLNIAHCREAGDEAEDDAIGGVPDIRGAEQGACYALAAFLTQNKFICERQFYLSNKMSCSIWLKDLSLDCLTCNEDSFYKNDKEYFYSLDTSALEDIDYCHNMVDGERKDNCFYHAAIVFKDANICNQILDKKKQDGCKSHCAYVLDK